MKSYIVEETEEYIIMNLDYKISIKINFNNFYLKGEVEIIGFDKNKINKEEVNKIVIEYATLLSNKVANYFKETYIKEINE